MRVKSIKLTNFKKFKDEHLEFNDDVNIFVGDNNAGKSTILEALEMVLNYNYRGRPFNTELTPDIFNKDAVQQFLASDKSAKHLPSLTIEAFIDGVPEYRGVNNFLKVDAQGITVQGVRLENGIYGHSRFCNTDFDDKLACLNLSGV